MTRFSTTATALLVALGLTCGVAPVAAQMTTTTENPRGDLVITTTAVEGRPEDRPVDLSTRPINLHECQDGALVSLRISSIPTDAMYLDFWWSNGGQCNDASIRSDTTDSSCKHIDKIGSDIIQTNGRQTLTVDIPASDLTDPDASDPCSGTSAYSIYVLATTSTGSTGEVGTAYNYFNVSLDTVPPSKPTNVSGGDGENSLSVSWDTETDASNLERYLVFVSESTAGCGATGTDAGSTDAGSSDAGSMDAGSTDAGATDAGGGLDAGSTDAGPMAGDGGALADGGGLTVLTCRSIQFSPDAVPAGFTCVGDAPPTADSTSIDATNYAIGQTLQVGIIAVDKAYNTSELTYTCVTRIDTTGFCEALGGCPDTCSCSVPGATGSSPLPALGALAALGLVLAVRRRR